VQLHLEYTPSDEVDSRSYPEEDETEQPELGVREFGRRVVDESRYEIVSAQQHWKVNSKKHIKMLQSAFATT
jgi:hypothetical protein